MCQRVTLVNTPQNDLLENGLGVCIPKGASMGATHVLEVLHPAVEVAVLHEVLCDLNSAAVWDLLPRVAHRLGDQKVRPGRFGFGSCQKNVNL